MARSFDLATMLQIPTETNGQGVDAGEVPLFFGLAASHERIDCLYCCFCVLERGVRDTRS